MVNKMQGSFNKLILQSYGPRVEKQGECGPKFGKGKESLIHTFKNSRIFVCYLRFRDAVTEFIASKDRPVIVWWTGKDVAGNGDVLFKLISRYLPGDTVKYHGNPARIAGLQGEISTRDLQKTKQDCKPLCRDVC
jgi:hypothetical protein